MIDRSAPVAALLLLVGTLYGHASGVEETWCSARIYQQLEELEEDVQAIDVLGKVNSKFREGGKGTVISCMVWEYQTHGHGTFNTTWDEREIIETQYRMDNGETTFDAPRYFLEQKAPIGDWKLGMYVTRSPSSKLPAPSVDTLSTRSPRGFPIPRMIMVGRIPE